MENLIQKLKDLIIKNRSFILYIMIGFTGLALDMISLVVMVRVLHMNDLIANTISMSVGIVNNFFLNAYFNFKKTDKLLSRFLSFYAVGLFGIGIGTAFLWFFNGVIGAQVSAILSSFAAILAQYRLEIVKAVSIVVIAIIQYFLNKKFSFKH